MAPPDFDRSVNPISTGGGLIVLATVLPAPPDFQTLRRAWVLDIFCEYVAIFQRPGTALEIWNYECQIFRVKGLGFKKATLSTPL